MMINNEKEIRIIVDKMIKKKIPYSSGYMIYHGKKVNYQISIKDKSK